MLVLTFFNRIFERKTKMLAKRQKVYVTNDDDDTESTISVNSSFTSDASTRFKQISTTGCCGCFERLPLTLKLLIMNAISLTGAVIIGVLLLVMLFTSMQSDQSYLKFHQVCVNAGTYTAIIYHTNCTGNAIHEIQKERGSSNFFVASNGTSFGTALQLQRSKTDPQLQIFVDFLNYLNPQSDSARYMNANISLLATLRRQVDALSISRAQSFGNYTMIIKSMLDFMLQYSLQSASSLSELVALNTLIRMKETMGQQRYAPFFNVTQTNRAHGVAIVTMGKYASTADYVQMVQINAEEKSLINILTAEASKEHVDDFQALVSGPQIAPVNSVINTLVNNPNALSFGIDPNYWWNITSFKIDLLKSVENAWASDFKSGVTNKINNSVATVVVTFVLMAAFFVLALVIALITSRTIIGPWQRMLDLQANTISKFVPTGFLRLLRCSSLADVHIGKSVQREITIVFSDIRDFTSLSEKMSPDETFRLV